MSFRKAEKKETNTYEIEFLLEKDAFDAACTRAFKKQVVKMNIPGFRKGKAPRAIVEKMYGKGVFYEDAINELLPAAYAEAEKESGLTVVSRPEFDIGDITDEGVIIKAKVFVKPEVKLEGYKGIEVEKEVIAVKEEEIDAELSRLRERNARTIDISDRAAANGDIANINFEGFSDGVAFEGGKGENYDLTLGSGQFIPGFEEQIIGHAIGDEFEVNVTFPEDYHAEDLKGKPVVFKTKLNSLKMKELPVLDDEFAKDVSDFDNLADFKADIHSKAAERKEKEANNRFEEKLTEKLTELIEAEIPQCMIDDEAENFLRDYDNQLRSQGLSLKDYTKYTGQTLDTLRESFAPRAQRQLKARLALEKIAELENIEVSDEEINKEYEKLAAEYNMKADEIKKYITDDGVKQDVKMRKAAELVKANAVVTEKKESTENESADAPKAKAKKPAKKTAAKTSQDEAKDTDEK